MTGYGLHGKTAFAATKVLAFVVLALLVGVGIVYAPVPMFVVAAVPFALGLWLLTRGGRRSFAGPEASGGVEERSRPRSTPTTLLVSGYLLFWWVALIAPILSYSPRGQGDPTASAGQGSLVNQVLIVSFGLVGAYFLPAAMRRRFDPAFRWIAALWVLYLGWAFTSLLWSIYLPLTLRNVVAQVLVSVGCFGLGAGFYGNHPDGGRLFLRHVFVGGVLSALVILLPLPFRWQQYDLLNPSSRLAIAGDFPTFVVRPIVCVLLIFVVTPILGLREWRRRDWLWIAVLVIPLLALKSRGPIVWGALALALFFVLYRVRAQDRLLQAGLLLVAALGAYVFYSGGLFASLIPYLTRGNVQNTLVLSGRLPLWGVLIQRAGEHPWLGAGFAAFWSPDNIRLVSLLAGFEAVSSHNGFLEETLNTGLVGLAILSMFFLCTMAVVMGRARRGDPLGWIAFLLLLFYLLLNLTNALVQEYQEFPFLVLLALLALMASKPMSRPSAAAETRRLSASRPPPVGVHGIARRDDPL